MLFKAWKDPLGPMVAIMGSVAILVLFLGALGLVNVTVVTIQQRIREIGIRRSFGATDARVFFAVMMESTVATTLAGILGIALTMVLTRTSFITQLASGGIAGGEESAVSTLPFPIEAAVIGLLISVGTGTLAGIIPALIATRVKIIDAIRA
jgi:putative ABC transport system permease protein